jgi:hypothetical protein
VSSLEKLYQSPLATAGEFAVVVSGDAGASRQKLAHGPQDLTFMQVYASTPVYAKCTADNGCLSVEAANLGTGGTRIYFLPWSRTSIYRIRPKAGNTLGLSGNLFFTPNLDGCMVTVEGTPENPTVYHANAAFAQLTDDEQNLLDRASGASNEDFVDKVIRIGKMKTSQEAFSAIPPKNPPPPVLNPPNKAHFDLLEYDRGSTAQITPSKFGQDMTESLHYGTVFGVRKNGAWTFYKQSYRIVKRKWFVEERGFLGMGKPQVVKREECKYNVASIQKLWP